METASPKFYFDYELTLEDYLEFNLYTNMGSPNAKKKLRKQRIHTAAMIAFVLVLFLMSCIVTGGLSNRWFAYAYIFIIVAELGLLFLYSPIFLKWNIRRVATKIYQKKENACPEQTALSFFEEKMREITEINENAIAYEKLLRWHVGEEAIYLYTTPINAYILPRRVVGKEREEAFLKFLRERIPEGKEE